MTTRIGTVLLLLVFAAAAASTPAAGYSLTGFVYTPFGNPFAEMAISACQTGDLGSYSLAWSWAAAPVGWYSLDNLNTGTYSIGFNEKDEWNRAFIFGVPVPYDGSFNRRIDYVNYGTGKFWDGNKRNWWAQSFAATGTSIVSVSIDCALEFGPNTTITIHDTDPWGAQIGPARTVPTNIANPSAAYWSAGDVPTVPGHIYCAKFSAPGQLMPFYSGVRVRNANIYPEGRTWYDGNLSAFPMKTVIGQDDDGIVTTVSTRKLKPLDYWPGTTLGQTFTANGSSVLGVGMMLGNTNGVVKVTIHDGVGINGAGGTQIGPAKYVKVDNWNHRCMAVWAPGEAGPLQAGHSYYVKVIRPEGGSFVMYHPSADEYSGGQGYVNGYAQSGDASITIALEAYSGSTSVQTVSIGSINVSRGVDTATISWTSTASNESYVVYGANTPYTNRSDDTNSTNHSVTLTGLLPNTLYHYKVVSKAAGKRDGVSSDMVFVTNPLTPNLLTNPGFETGSISPWMNVGSGGIQNYPSGGSSSFFGAKAHSGNYMHASASNGGQITGGCYQRVAVTPGRTLRARAWLWTWQVDPLNATMDYTVAGRVGIDPTGGTDVDSGNIVWSNRVAAQDLLATYTNGAWTEVWTSTTAVSNYATVFIKSGADHALTWIIYAHDDFVLTQDPIAVSSLADLDSVANGSTVAISGLVVTATQAQAGAVYLEEPNRSRGIRVESTDTFTVGKNVYIGGIVGTKPSGERYIHSATKGSESAADPVGSMATTVKSIGKVGPGNVGMLMRVAGTVASGGAGYVYINDGSLAGSGLKLITSSLTTPPTPGQFVTVTGIVQLEGTSPASAIPVLRARSQADLTSVN